MTSDSLFVSIAGIAAGEANAPARRGSDVTDRIHGARKSTGCLRSQRSNECLNTS